MPPPSVSMPTRVVIRLGPRTYSTVSSVDDELVAYPYINPGRSHNYGMTVDLKNDLDYGDVDFSFQDAVEEPNEGIRLLSDQNSNCHAALDDDKLSKVYCTPVL